MAIQKHRLHAREQRIAAVQMTPTRLDHADFRIGEKVDRALEQIARWNEVRIENANEFAAGGLETNRKSARFKTGAIDPMNELNIVTSLPESPRARTGYFAGVVSGIVQDLDLEQIFWVIEFANRAKQALDHVNFVKNRELNRYFWQLPETRRRKHCPFPVFQKEINDEIPVNAVGGEADEHGEVASRPNHVAETSLHKVGCQLLRQQVRMMALPSPASNQKWLLATANKAKAHKN